MLWQVLLGHLASLERLVPHGRLRMRSLQWHLKGTYWSPESDSPPLLVPLSQEVREDLSWWMVRDHLLVGVRFGTPAPKSTPVLRRVSVGVGRTPPRSSCVWGVGGPGEVAAHQSPVDEGFVSSTAVIPGVGSAGHHMTAMCKQLNGGDLRQQAGQDGVPFSLLVGQSASEVGRRVSTSTSMPGIFQGSSVFWQTSSAVGIRL